MSARLRAFLVHFATSLAVAFLGGWVVFGLWYPAPLDLAVGVSGIFILLLSVDVLLGPLLTLLVFKVGKASLVFDLSVIVCLQLTALLYGFFALAEGRPAWLVFSVDRFDLIRMADIEARDLGGADEQYLSASWLGPRWVAAMLPSDPARSSAIIFDAVEGRADISQRPELYRPLDRVASNMRSKAHPLVELYKYNPAEAVDCLLADWPGGDAWLPLKAGAKAMVVLIDKEAAKVVAVVDLAPW